MKYLILFIVLISFCLSNDKIEKLENIYIDKANKLKAARDKVILAATLKHLEDSGKLVRVYIRALESLLKAETQKGDFDSAIAIKVKIVEMEKALAGNIVKVVPTKPISVHHDLIGVWHTTNTRGTKYIYTFYKDGTSFHENNSNKNTISGKWKAQENDIHIVFSNKHSFTFKRVGNLYKGPHYEFKKHVADPFVGQWKAAKISNGNIVTIKKNSTGYTLNNSISGSLWTTASIIINGKLILSWASFQTLVIESNKQGITYTQYRQKFNGKYPTGKIGKWNKIQMTRITSTN